MPTSNRTKLLPVMSLAEAGEYPRLVEGDVVWRKGQPQHPIKIVEVSPKPGEGWYYRYWREWRGSGPPMELRIDISDEDLDTALHEPALDGDVWVEKQQETLDARKAWEDQR